MLHFRPPAGRPSRSTPSNQPPVPSDPPMSKVCVLAPDHAEALEERGRIPDCRYHGHLSHLEADAAVALEFDHKNGHTIEGWGQARTVRSIDGRRRITPI